MSVVSWLSLWTTQCSAPLPQDFPWVEYKMIIRILLSRILFTMVHQVAVTMVSWGASDLRSAQTTWEMSYWSRLQVRRIKSGLKNRRILSMDRGSTLWFIRCKERSKKGNRSSVICTIRWWNNSGRKWSTTKRRFKRLIEYSNNEWTEFKSVSW